MPDTKTNTLFFGTRGDPLSSVVIVGEAWGQEEAIQQKPFVGGSGRLLDEMLSEANIDANKCLFTNIMADQPPNNEFEHYLDFGRGTVGGLNPKPELMTGLTTLYQQLDFAPRSLIISCGNYPLWALTNFARITTAKNLSKPSGISDFHGSQLYRLNHRLNLSPHSNATGNIPVLPIYHPAAILRDYSLRHTTIHDLKTRVKIPSNQWAGPARTYYAPPDLTFIRKVFSMWIKNKFTIVLDIENASSPQHILTCIGLAESPNWAMSIPFVDLVDGKFISYWKPSEEKIVLKLLSELFNSDVKFIGQNLVYDTQWLYHTLRMRPKVFFDTLIAQNLLFPGTRKSLGELSAMYCAHHKYWKDDNHEWSTTGTLRQHLVYNCEDVVRTFEIAQNQIEILHHIDLIRHLPFEMEKFELAREMNERGIRRNEAKTLDAGRRIIEQMTSLGNRLSRLVKQEWIPTKVKKPVPWYRSDAQIKFVLYTLLALPTQFDRKTGRPTSGKEALAALKEDFPRLRLLFDNLLDYGSLDTIYSTFIKSKTDPDGRIHASFNPAGTATFRWSSSKNAFNRASNMQNIPVGGEDE